MLAALFVPALMAGPEIAVIRDWAEDSAGALAPGLGRETPTAAGAFQPVAPSRFLDARTTAPVAPDASVTFQVGGINGIPANASAVVFNLTATEPSSYGFVTAYASGTSRPGSSNVNFNTGQTIPNSVTVPVGADGKVSLFNRSSGTTHLIADVSGYYLAGTPTAAGAFQPLAPRASWTPAPQPQSGARLELDLDPSFEHGILLDTGNLSLDGTPLAVDHLHYLRPGRSRIVLEAGQAPARLLLLGGEPLGERIVMWWNFVGRTHEEVVAYRSAWQAEIGAEPADPPAGNTYPDETPYPRFGPFPDGYPAPLPAPALPNAQLRARG